jgi:predicted ATP-grasp superfamily ATP-dependent carboligase
MHSAPSLLVARDNAGGIYAAVRIPECVVPSEGATSRRSAVSMTSRRKAWVLAAWPGMAGVGQIACSYLRDHLEMTPLVEFGANGWFEPESVRVERGLVLPSRRPRSFVSLWSTSNGERDVLLVQGEQQPTFDSMRYARAVLDACSARDIERVITFAALATAMDPRDPARVFAASTSQTLLDEALNISGVSVLDDAEVSGMNGQFLCAARERDIPAIGLLGEVPYFASGLPNPKASAAALRVALRMLNVELSLEGLLDQARRLQAWIVRQLPAGDADESKTVGGEGKAAIGDSQSAGGTNAAQEAERTADLIQRIELLFQLAQQDRGKAKELKAELDRHGLFHDYEDRFLDLFRSGS